jgi:hypothetical protein
MMIRQTGLALALLAFSPLALGACKGRAEVVNHCDTASSTCSPCASDADCAFTGNACTETVYCAHRDASIVVITIGCDPAAEYSWPDDDECACVAATCRYSGQ